MDRLTFTSEIISSIAWPIAVVTICLILKDQLSELLKRITKVKHGDSEVDFGHQVRMALDEAEKGELTRSSLNRTNGSELSMRLAEQSPRGAILDAWLKVEKSMSELSKRHGIAVDERHPPYQQIRAIEMYSMDAGLLGKGVFQMLDKLRTLRNDAVHLVEADITAEVAMEYIDLANRVRGRLEEA